MRILSLGGVVGPIIFVVVVMLAAALRPGYSHVTDFISELGATGTANAALMNYAGFVPAGLMLAVFGVSLAWALPRHRFTMVAAALVALFGAGVAASGFISCDPHCPQTDGSVENLVHNRIAPLSFLCLTLGAGILGIYFRRLSDWRAFSVYSLLTGALALVFLVALASSLDSRALTGLWQRLLLFVIFLWCAVIGLRAFQGPIALRSPSSKGRSHGSD